MPPSIPEYLKERLPADLYERLRVVSEGFSKPLFAVDPETGRFECAADFDPDEMGDPAILDALCIACELLSDADLPFDCTEPVVEAVESRGEIRLTYDFTAEEGDVFQRFRDLLRENTPADAGFQTDFQKYPWGHRVVVDLGFQSDFDYQRKKDFLDLMLLVARRRSNHVPFFGKRL